MDSTFWCFLAVAALLALALVERLTSEWAAE